MSEKIMSILHAASGALETHLERNMVVADADLELLLANNVLLWPIGVIFPVDEW